MPPTPQIYTHPTHSHLLPSLASLHAKTITHDSTLSYFALPLSQPKLESWWTDRAQDTVAGTRLLVLITPDPDDPDFSGLVVVAAALLSTPWGQTGPFRAVVEGVWVDPVLRRRGFGRAVVRKMEGEAGARGRKLFVVEAEDGGVVQEFWEGVGYRKMGVVPDRAISPKDESPRDMAYYYKDIRGPAPESA